MTAQKESPLRVLSFELHHESNTLCADKTDIKAFQAGFILEGSAALNQRGNDVNTELAGFNDVAKEQGWDLTHVLSAKAGPGGIVTSEAFTSLVTPLIEAAQTGDYNGVVLSLHGAMVTEGHDDGDAEILRQLRAVVGPDIPIAVTLDPHANVAPDVVNNADIVTSYRTYPHTDMEETGSRAANILHRTMMGEINPHTVVVQVPMMEEVNGGRTDEGPMLPRIKAARGHEELSSVFDASINGGFATGSAFVGPSVTVVYEGDSKLHRDFAETVAMDMWNGRHEAVNDYLSVEEVAKTAASYENDKPLIIADYADNPGAGAPGDSTNLLGAMVDAKVKNACFGPMVDGDVVAQMHQGKVGDIVDIELGGKTNASLGGGPLTLKAEIISIVSDGVVTGDGPMLKGLTKDFGTSAVLRVDGIDILVVTKPHQMLDLQQFKTFGINPGDYNVVGLKSMQHFRAAFAPVAGEILVCDSGALCTTNYNRSNFPEVPHGTYPLEDPSECILRKSPGL